MSKIEKPKRVYQGPSSPTPEFQDRHDVLAPAVDRKTRREAFEVKTRLASLVKEGHNGASPNEAVWIGPAEYLAAMRWRDDFDAAEGVRDKGDLALGRISGSKSSDGITNRMIGAAHRLRAVRDALGSTSTTVLRQVIVYDTSWPELGRMVGVSNHTAKSWTCTILRALLGYYDQLDQVAIGKAAPIRMAEFADERSKN